MGIEAHSNRYFFDYNTVQFLEMVGGYIDGDLFVPVRFGIKQSNNQNTLYVIIDEEGIKKTKVIKSVLTDKLRSTDSRLVCVSIADVLRNVNNKDFLRFVPNGLLEQKRLAEANANELNNLTEFPARKLNQNDIASVVKDLWGGLKTNISNAEQKALITELYEYIANDKDVTSDEIYRRAYD